MGFNSLRPKAQLFEAILALWYRTLALLHIKLRYDVIRLWQFDDIVATKEGTVLFNDALNTFYLRLYGVRHYGKVPHR